MNKWTAQEIAEDKSLIRRVEDSDIRQCSHCGIYTNVETQAGEHEFEDGTVKFDICDECVALIEKGIEPVVVEEYSYDDYEEEELEELDEEDNVETEE